MKNVWKVTFSYNFKSFLMNLWTINVWDFIRNLNTNISFKGTVLYYIQKILFVRFEQNKIELRYEL